MLYVVFVYVYLLISRCEAIAGIFVRVYVSRATR